MMMPTRVVVVVVVVVNLALQRAACLLGVRSFFIIVVDPDVVQSDDGKEHLALARNVRSVSGRIDRRGSSTVVIVSVRVTRFRHLGFLFWNLFFWQKKKKKREKLKR